MEFSVVVEAPVHSMSTRPTKASWPKLDVALFQTGIADYDTQELKLTPRSMGLITALILGQKSVTRASLLKVRQLANVTSGVDWSSLRVTRLKFPFTYPNPDQATLRTP